MLALGSVVLIFALSEIYVRSQVPVSLFGSDVYVDSWDDGYVTFTGTWSIEGQKHAFPLNFSKVLCDASTKSCTDSQARIFDGSGTHFLDVIADTHEISRWDKETLTYQSSARCVEYVYTVSRTTKQVTGIRKKKATNQKSCSDAGVEHEELGLRLTNGHRIYQQMQETARPVAVSVAAMVFVLFYWAFRMRRVVMEPKIGSP